MKKFAWLSIASLVLSSFAFATTQTTHYSLYKPNDGSTSWGSNIRDNFDVIDSQMFINSSDITGHLNDAVAAHAATAISTSVGGLTCTSAITVQEFLDCLDLAFGSVFGGNVVNTTSNQTVAGIKTWSSNAIFQNNVTISSLSTGVLHSTSGAISSSNIVDVDIDSAAAITRSKLASGTASHVIINNGSGVMSSEASLAISRGGTGQATATLGFDALSPMTALGDTIYGGASGTRTALAGNITSTKKFLTQTGNGSISAAPGWNTIIAADVPTLNQNTTGTALNVTGTVAIANGGTGQTSKAAGFDALSPMTAGGDLIYGGASGTGTRLANGSAGQVLQSNGTTVAPSWASVTTVDQSYEISNLTLTATVAANALTIAVKTKAGTDATGSDIVKVGFRNSTITTGTYAQRTITAALSMSVPSGTTIGTVSGNTENLFVYLIDNAGTPELAISANSFVEEGSTVNTTAVSGGASRSVVYSTTARTGVAIRLVGKIIISEATAGTWASSPTLIGLLPFIKGQFFSSANTYLRTETAAFSGNSSMTADCTASPCTLFGYSTGWITNVTRSATGTYSVNFATAVFSAAPICMVVVAGNGSASTAFISTVPTSSAVGVRTLTTIAADGGAYITCTGPR